jgi:plasmid stability protein
MVALARTDSWWARSPYSGARDADVYQDIARSFPIVILTDVVRDGDKARYMVRGVYQAHMAPGDQEPEFETLFQYEGDGAWYQAPQLPIFPSRVSPQTIQPTLLIAKQGLACHQRGDREKARALLEQAVRQTRRPDPRWLAVLRELANGKRIELMNTAQTAWEDISKKGGREANEQILNDVRRARPTLYAFIELVEMTSKGKKRKVKRAEVIREMVA